ncbi:MAG: tripartite tricarboxylate transporter substrate binding protein [Betaproteobacteria bacterium]|nr:MAG: tripartite tricarboxylate transporter substrate binding protein [Betaproteobacteria bacterium]
MKSIVAIAYALLASVLFVISGPAGAQQNYPSRPLRLISPYAPGGGNDTMARLIAQALTESLGQQVIVDNRPGANTMIGTDIVAKSRPDGHTFLFSGISTFLINALLLKTPYDSMKDFAPIAPLAVAEMILVSNPSLPATNLRELIALAKAKPGELNYATSSAGGAGHLVGELFKMMAGINIQHIPYKGTSQALSEVMGGQIELSLQSAVSTVPHVRSGKLRGIAVSGDKRYRALPQVPTFAEAGLPGLQGRVIYGILGPAHIPAEIVGKLSGDIARIQRTPAFQEKLFNQGVEPFILSPDQFGALMRSELATFDKVIKTAHIKLK